MTELDAYWEKFLEETGRDSDEKCAGDLNFDAKGFLSAELITLVLSGQKKAFFTTLPTFTINQEPLPVSGELYIVVDNQNKPRCVIEVDSVEIIPFNEVTWEMAKMEGECQNLGEWKEKETEYIDEESHIVGFDFSPDIRLVFQTFSVVYR